MSERKAFDPNNAIERAHTLILKAGADSAEELAWELRHLADMLEQGKLTVGCIGGPSAGTVYSYRMRPEQTHDVYFQQIKEWLAEERALSAREKEGQQS